MSKSNDFLEFVKNNPPACVPGDRLYWFDEESGEIKQDDRGIEAIVLDEDWTWKIIDPDNGDIVGPNENQYFCITKEDAKNFRDKVGTVKYAIFVRDESGRICVDYKQYSLLATKTFDVTMVSIDDCYIDYVVDHDEDVMPDMVVWFGRMAYMITENGVIPNCHISADGKMGTRILEDIFDQ